jgi:hypothetical protein
MGPARRAESSAVLSVLNVKVRMKTNIPSLLWGFVACYGKPLYLLTKVNKRKVSWVHSTPYPVDIVESSPDERRSLYLYPLLYSTYEKGSIQQAEITLSTYPKDVTKRHRKIRLNNWNWPYFYALYLLFDDRNSIYTRHFREFYK